ncbi:MAG: hypothetical protein OXN85_04725 [Gemmatimonadetes bacterium]|nr:hypothetical protein [Candidatus Palauibacter australiensis]
MASSTSALNKSNLIVPLALIVTIIGSAWWVTSSVRGAVQTVRSELEAIHVAIDTELDGIRDVAESVRDRLADVEDQADAILRNPLDLFPRPSASR